MEGDLVLGMMFVVDREDTRNGKRGVHGTLRWGTRAYKAISGYYGKGPLPYGEYDVKTRDVVTGPHMAPPFCVGRGDSKLCYFIPVEPKFDAGGRDGFGIHPDGNVIGSEGCIALTEGEARRFWANWMATALGDRPTILSVTKQESALLLAEDDLQVQAVRNIEVSADKSDFEGRYLLRRFGWGPDGFDESFSTFILEDLHVHLSGTEVNDGAVLVVSMRGRRRLFMHPIPTPNTRLRLLTDLTFHAENGELVGETVSIGLVMKDKDNDPIPVADSDVRIINYVMTFDRVNVDFEKLSYIHLFGQRLMTI